MSLRARFVVYIVAVHLVFCVSTALLLDENRLWLLGVEAFFVVSLSAGLVLVRRLFEPLRLIRSGIEFIKASEFGTRFREVGQSDLDPLIRVYNRMADTLREERIRSEEQEHFLQRIITVSPTGILTLDLDGRVTMANASARALLARRWDDLKSRRLDELGSPFAAQLAGLETGESRIVPLHGRRRVRCRALTFMDRGFARRFLLMDELTEELHRSEKAAYEKLIRVMSHEVNNTAGAVGSLLDSCHSYSRQIAEADRDDFVHAMSVAISRTDRMNQFMQRFAEVVRLPDPRRQPSDVRELAEEVALLLREESEERCVAWQWDAEPDLPAVDLDPAQMEQVLLNVYRNALEAVGEKGTVAVRLGRANGRPFLSVEDSGPGIPPEVEEQLFTPFYSSKENGQGIGLTVVREVLLRHGFDYSLENREGGGAVFRILF